MADTHHDAVQYAELAAMYGVMAACNRHTFQVLTKKPENAARFFDHMHRTGPVPEAVMQAWRDLLPEAAMNELIGSPKTWLLPNVWLGTSVENQQYAERRIPELLKCPAAVRWLSVGPLLGPVDLSPWVGKLDWVVVGGESGSGARPCKAEWIERVVDDCRAANVSVFLSSSGSSPTTQTSPTRPRRKMEAL